MTTISTVLASGSYHYVYMFYLSTQNTIDYGLILSNFFICSFRNGEVNTTGVHRGAMFPWLFADATSLVEIRHPPRSSWDVP